MTSSSRAGSLALLATFAATACSLLPQRSTPSRFGDTTGAPTPAPTALPEAIRLRIANVQVDADNYDPALPPPKASLFCTLLSKAADKATAGLGGIAVDSVCSSLTDPKGVVPDRRAEAPDLAIGLKVGDAVLYKSPTNYNTFSAATRHSFVVPLAALPAEGLFLVIVDEDNVGHEQIGSFRLERDELLALRGRGLQRLAREEGRNAGDLEVIVEDFLPVDVELDLPADEGTLKTGLDVPAGAVLEVTASGAYRLAKGGGLPEIGPAGLPGTAKHPGNVFAEAQHGEAFVIVGDGDYADHFVLPVCRRLVGVKAGFALLGINDQGNTADNSGSVHFRVRLRAPLAEEWGKPLAATDCRL